MYIVIGIFLWPETVGGSKNPFGIDQRPSTKASFVFQQSHVGQRVGLHFFATNNLWAIACSIGPNKSARVTDFTN